MDRVAGRSLRSRDAPPKRLRPAGAGARAPLVRGVRDRLNRVLEARALPAGTDLKRTLIVAMLEHIDAGWHLGEFGSRGGSFFCVRGSERCSIGVEAADPGKPVGYGAAHLAWSPQQLGHDE
jgi:hypothetical protein